MRWLSWAWLNRSTVSQNFYCKQIEKACTKLLIESGKCVSKSAWGGQASTSLTQKYFVHNESTGLTGQHHWVNCCVLLKLANTENSPGCSIFVRNLCLSFEKIYNVCQKVILSCLRQLSLIPVFLSLIEQGGVTSRHYPVWLRGSVLVDPIQLFWKETEVIKLPFVKGASRYAKWRAGFSTIRPALVKENLYLQEGCFHLLLTYASQMLIRKKEVHSYPCVSHLVHSDLKSTCRTCLHFASFNRKVTAKCGKDGSE